MAALDGPLVLVQSATTADIEACCLNWLVKEVSTSIITAAAGGNASLMTIGQIRSCWVEQVLPSSRPNSI